MQTEQELQLSFPFARQVIRKMRDEELRFSQDLKARVFGQPSSFAETQARATLGMETYNDSTASQIAQLGTVLEPTLAMLHDLLDAEWNTEHRAACSIRNDVLDLIWRDQCAPGSIPDTVGVRIG